MVAIGFARGPSGFGDFGVVVGDVAVAIELALVGGAIVGIVAAGTLAVGCVSGGIAALGLAMAIPRTTPPPTHSHVRLRVGSASTID